jgi:CRP/FNR family transcriptional regulator
MQRSSTEVAMHAMLRSGLLPGHAATLRCTVCALRSLCLCDDMTNDEVRRLEQLVTRRRRLLCDDVLYRMGDQGGTLYAIRLGHFKSMQADRNGREHLTAFPMVGELLGMDSIGTGIHASTAVALEDSEVCEIPYARLLDILPQMPGLLVHFHRLLGREILRGQAAMIFLGNMRADQRLASFLLNLGERYAMRGYSSRSFLLRMSRDDIAGYLGLTPECISRQLAAFRRSGWIRLEKRAIELADQGALVALAAGLQPALAMSTDSLQPHAA